MSPYRGLGREDQDQITDAASSMRMTYLTGKNYFTRAATTSISTTMPTMPTTPMPHMTRCPSCCASWLPSFDGRFLADDTDQQAF